MTPQLTPEQLRQIDALVAECMGWRNMVDPDKGAYVLLPPDRAEKLATQYGYIEARPFDEPFFDWDHSLPYYSTEHNDWAIVEEWMVDNADGVRYVQESATLVQPGVIFSFYTAFLVATAPIHVRCLAFLSAMGKDVEEILK